MANAGDTKPDLAKLRSFPNLKAESFQLPGDRKASQAVQQIPVVPQMLKALSGGLFEKMARMDQIANSYRLSPLQGRSIYRLIARAAEILAVDPIPEVFVRSGELNAYASGIDKYTITLTSSIISVMTEAELLFVIGHELGHIKCAHMANKTLAHYVGYFGVEGLAMYIPVVGPLALQGLMAPLAHWSRLAELSCDRAGLLAVQDAAIAASALSKLGGWLPSEMGPINFEAVEAQLDEFETADEGMIDSLLKVKKAADTRYDSHPLTAMRIRKIRQWGMSDQYRSILETAQAAGNVVESAQVTCVHCGSSVSAGDDYCAVCGTRSTGVRTSLCCPNEDCRHPIRSSQLFCTKCGTSVGRTDPAVVA